MRLGRGEGAQLIRGIQASRSRVCENTRRGTGKDACSRWEFTHPWERTYPTCGGRHRHPAGAQRGRRWSVSPTGRRR
jgi:hypothetical protein